MLARRSTAKASSTVGVGIRLPIPRATLRDRAARLVADGRQAAGVWRAGAVLLFIVVAYRYSLQTLVQEMGQESPLAYLGLIPFIALLLAVALARPQAGEPDIHDRYLDYIVGVPLITLALLLLLFAPAAVPSVYWLHRVDLLSLPLFVAGAISLAFGMRALVRIRAAVAFLLLAWPWPYIVFLDRELNWFTDTTAAAVKAMLHLIPVASVAPDGDFLVAHGANPSQSFTLTVSSACSGINSGLGFLIVGGAAAILMRGRRSLRILWLVAGAALMFVVNVARILLVLAAGRQWGEQFAIDVLHPLIGLVMILVATLVMLLLLPRFHLSLDHLVGLRRRDLSSKAVVRAKTRRAAGPGPTDRARRRQPRRNGCKRGHVALRVARLRLGPLAPVAKQRDGRTGRGVDLDRVSYLCLGNPIFRSRRNVDTLLRRRDLRSTQQRGTSGDHRRRDRHR